MRLYMRSKFFLLILITFCGIEYSCSDDFSGEKEKLIFSEQLPILGWYGIPENEATVERFTEMKEAGFTLNFTHSFSDADKVASALDMAQKAGMKIVIRCPELGTEPENTTHRFMEHPALAGYFFRDEPSAKDFSSLSTWVKRVQSVDDKNFCYINLLPNYATIEQLGVDTYREYVNKFIHEVPLSFYSFDNYPLTQTGLKVSLRDGWYENLEIFSDEARKAGKPFWAFALTTPRTGLAVPNLGRLRLQVYSNLAYGAQGIQYFTYWTPSTPKYDFHDGPIYNGKRTSVYDDLTILNNEIKNLSGVFLGTNVVSVAHTGEIIPKGTKRLSELPVPIQVLETIGEGAVVSLLEKGENKFLVVVNRDYIESTELHIKASEKIKRVNKDGSLTDIRSQKEKSIKIGPGDVEIFVWEK